MRKSTVLIIAVMISSCLSAQTPVEVAENTLKVSPASEEIFFYGFAEGDQVIFSFYEANGKELKELEISGINSSSLFLDYKSKKIENKVIAIPATGIYKFRFANSNLLAGRICKFKIQRIPAAEETRKFNSTVYKRMVYDSTYYDAPERFLVKQDTIITEVQNQTAKVHSTLNANGNRTVTNFSLPPNTIAWSYYIGVDQAGQQAYESATQQLSSASTVAAKVPGWGPLAALALGLAPHISRLQQGEDIDYVLLPTEYVTAALTGQQYKYLKQGKIVNDYAKMQPDKRNLCFFFTNDNAIQGVTVLVKVVAIHIEQKWEMRPVKKLNVTAREEMYLKS